MSVTAMEVMQCAEWMRLQAVCLSRSENERALFAMTGEWLAAWAQTDAFHDDAAVRQFVAECLQTASADYRAMQGTVPAVARVLH